MTIPIALELEKVYKLLKPYFKPDIREKIENNSFNYLNLSFADIDLGPDSKKLNIVKTLFQKFLTKEQISTQRSKTEESFKESGKRYRLENLYPEKLEEVNEAVKESAIKTAARKTEAFFKKGSTFGQISVMPATQMPDLVITGSDFMGKQTGQLVTQQQLNHQVDLALCRKEIRIKIAQKQAAKLSSQVEEMISSQKARAQLLAYVSKETGTSIDDLDDGVIETHREAFEEAKKAFEKTKADAAEAKRAKAEAELLEGWDDTSTPVQSKQTSKKKKKRNAKSAKPAKPAKAPAEKPKPLSPKQQTIQRLNGLQGKLPFSSHPRVQRWQTTNHEVMRTFGESYRQEDEENLTYLRNAHNLAGIERVVSDKQLKEQYSYPSSHINHAGVEQKGRKFFASMKSGGKAYSGVIHLGINEESGEIFHAMFTQLENPTFSPNKLKELRVEEIEEEKAEGGWELVNSYQFDIDSDEVLHMKTGTKGKDQVHFSFYPLTL